MLGKRGVVLIGALAVCAALVVAGCGSSKKSSSSTAASSPASTTSSSAATASTSTGSSTGSSTGTSTGTSAAPTGDPLRVGIICACSGPVAGTFGGIPQLSSAWEQWTNAHGGINGHPVKVFLADDADNAATSATKVKELVANDHVQAIVDASFSEDSWKAYTNAQGIAISGGNQDNPQFSTEPLFFPSGGTFPAMYFGMTNELKKLGKTKVSVMACAELPVCAGVSKLFGAVGGVVGGVKVVSTSKISATAPSYLAQCLQAKNSGSDAALIAHSSDVTVRVVNNCAQQGYKPQLINYSSTMAANWLKDPNYNGVITAQPNAPLEDTTLPGMAAFHQALAQYAPAYLKQNTFGVITLNQWSGFELFKAAAVAGHITPTSTAKDLTAAMYQLHGATLGGISPPLTFAQGKPTLIPCYFVQGIKNGAYVAPDGLKPICIPEAKIPPLIKAITSVGG